MTDTIDTTPDSAGAISREPHPSGDDRFSFLDKHLKRVRYAQDQLIESLHVAQDLFGFLSDDILIYVARALRLPTSMVYGVATFYQLFTFEPPGDHSCTVCTGTACFVKGADKIVAAVGEAFSVAAGQTAEDRSLTLKTARCLGSCGLAPVVVIDGEVMAHLDAAKTVQKVGELLAKESV